MRKRRTFLLLVVGVVCVGVFVWLVRRDSEPEYGGRRLSGWVERHDDTPLVEKQASEDAIRHIGAKALPFLVKWIQYEQPAWRRQFDRALIAITGSQESILVFRDNRGMRGFWAADALLVLGPETDGEVAALSRLVNDSRASAGVSAAAKVLGSFGSTGLPSLLAVVTNQQSNAENRRVVTYYIGQMGPTARPAIPALRHLLTDSDWSLTWVVTNALRKIDPDALDGPGIK